MERKTGGSLLSTHTRINTHKHTHTHALATSGPSLAHAVALEVALNLGLVVNDPPAGRPVICQPARTKEPRKRRLCLSRRLLRLDSRILLRRNVFLLATPAIKIHKLQGGQTYYCESHSQKHLPPAVSFISALSEATCHFNTPPLRSFLILVFFFSFFFLPLSPFIRSHLQSQNLPFWATAVAFCFN